MSNPDPDTFPALLQQGLSDSEARGTIWPDQRSDILAGEAAAYERAAQHQPHFMFNVATGVIESFSCSCGVIFDPKIPGCPQWENHICGLVTPKQKSALAEHDERVQAGAFAVDAGNIEFLREQITAKMAANEFLRAHLKVAPVKDCECDVCATVNHKLVEARIKAITQCAIEAGERSPEGVSSDTMLGDMWDERLAALAKQLEENRKEEVPHVG